MRPERVHILSRRPSPTKQDWVLYWMQASVRIVDNLALEYAAQEAASRKLPLVVVFGLKEGYVDSGPRHASFLLDGLKYVAKTLRDMGIPFIVQNLPPHEAALDAAGRAALTVTDMGYTGKQRFWRREFVRQAPGPVIMVEDNVCVPVESVYEKPAVGARVIRPRINRVREEYLSDRIGLVETPKKPTHFDRDMTDAEDPVLEKSAFGTGPTPVSSLRGGGDEAEKVLNRFLEERLERYGEDKNDPSKKAASGLSPYIRYGHISVRHIARRVLSVGGEGTEDFLEELLIRRELAVNYAWYHPEYDDPGTLPAWARDNLDAHSADIRPYVYDEEIMENGSTHDPYWNACQKEMVHTGCMQGYMRMYWGKKVIEWTSDWRAAWHLLMKWNDKYELDGRDPNGYAGVAWCFGMHDRPWAQRPVFGSVRYMNDKGLRRKFDIDAYVRDVNARIAEVE